MRLVRTVLHSTLLTEAVIAAIMVAPFAYRLLEITR